MEAVSSEEEVRVRVKVIDDQFTVLYSQDIDMNGREGTFFVPAVITNTEEITVQVNNSINSSTCITIILHWNEFRCIHSWGTSYNIPTNVNKI